MNAILHAIYYKLFWDSDKYFIDTHIIAFWKQLLSPTYSWWRDEHDRTCVSLRTQRQSVASISNSKIHEYEHTQNNSVHAHQLYDDKSRISRARAAYPSTSCRDTRDPAARGHSTRWTALHSRHRCSTGNPVRQPWSHDTDQIVVISGDWECRKRFIGDLWTRRDSASPRQNGATFIHHCFSPTHWYVLSRVYLPAGSWINFTILLKVDSSISVISKKWWRYIRSLCIHLLWKI